jgi:GNAT superfamily N-acetyltransferase
VIRTIPVQRLGGGARAAYLKHLIALDPEDRRLRFGVPQSRAAIAAYVERINYGSDILFGVYGEELALQGVAHLALGSGFAELGVSVLPRARREGIGGALMSRAAEFARNRSITRLYVYCLAENFAMIRLARRCGMHVVVQSGDADAHLVLPAASPVSVISEFIADRVALLDYVLKTTSRLVDGSASRSRNRQSCKADLALTCVWA